LKTGLVALTLGKYVSNLLNILLHESERGGAGARGSTRVLSIVAHLIFFASSEAEMKDVVWGFWFNKRRGHVVATSLSATWHLVLVLKMREGEGGCKCSLWWLWVVGVGSCKM
jgi:hypothetical protein